MHGMTKAPLSARNTREWTTRNMAGMRIGRYPFEFFPFSIMYTLGSILMIMPCFSCFKVSVAINPKN